MAGVGTPRRLGYGAVAAGIGGIVLIISLFLSWFSAGGFSQTGWESLDFTDIALLILGLLAIGYAVVEMTGAVVNLPVRREHALTVIGIIATTLTLDILIEGSNQAFGLVLATLASIAILVGGILAERAPHLAVALGGGGGVAAPGAGGGYGGQPGGGYGAPPPTQQMPPAGGGFAPPAQQPPAGGGYEGGATSVGAVQPAQPAPPAQPAQPAAPPPPPGGKADWYPDPHGQKRLRSFDGTQWTEHTAD